MSEPMTGDSASGGRLRGHAGGSFSAFQAIQAAVAMVARPVTGAPYLLYFLIQMLLLAAYMTFNSGPAAKLWALPVRGVSPEMFGHYPAHLLLLKPVLERIEIILEILLKCVFHGATVCLAATVFRRDRLSVAGAFSRALRRYPSLLGVAVVSSALIYAAISLGAYISSGLGGISRYAALGGAIAAGLVLQALFVYAIPLVMIEGAAMPAAIASGISISIRTFSRTLLVVAIPFILTIPTTLIGLKAEMIALALSPEFMIHIHAASRVMEMIATYVVTVAAVALFLAVRKERSGGPARDGGGGPDAGSR